MIPRPNMLVPSLDGGMCVEFECINCHTHLDKGTRMKYCYNCGRPQEWDAIKASTHFDISYAGAILASPYLLELIRNAPHREQVVLLKRLETELNTGIKTL